METRPGPDPPDPYPLGVLLNRPWQNTRPFSVCGPCLNHRLSLSHIPSTYLSHTSALYLCLISSPHLFHICLISLSHVSVPYLCFMCLICLPYIFITCLFHISVPYHIPLSLCYVCLMLTLSSGWSLVTWLLLVPVTWLPLVPVTWYPWWSGWFPYRVWPLTVRFSVIDGARCDHVPWLEDGYINAFPTTLPSGSMSVGGELFTCVSYPSFSMCCIHIHLRGSPPGEGAEEAGHAGPQVPGGWPPHPTASSLTHPLKAYIMECPVKLVDKR